MSDCAEKCFHNTWHKPFGLSWEVWSSPDVSISRFLMQYLDFVHLQRYWKGPTLIGFHWVFPPYIYNTIHSFQVPHWELWATSKTLLAAPRTKHTYSSAKNGEWNVPWHGQQNARRTGHGRTKLVQQKQSLKLYLLGQLCQWFGPREVCEPVVDGALRPRRDQREVVLLVDLWLALARVRERVVAQFLRNDAAEVGANLWRRRSRRPGEEGQPAGRTQMPGASGLPLRGWSWHFWRCRARRRTLPAGCWIPASRWAPSTHPENKHTRQFLLRGWKHVETQLHAFFSIQLSAQ